MTGAEYYIRQLLIKSRLPKTFINRTIGLMTSPYKAH